MSKKPTKQSRRTTVRKNRQRRTRIQARALLGNWLKTPEGQRARQLRDAAMMRAITEQF